MDLSADQRALVEHSVHARAMLIVAGPGSGKTRVLCERIIWLLEQGVEAHQIAALTFTQQAALELRSRVNAASQTDVWAGTFHGFASHLLHEHGALWGAPSPVKVIDQIQQSHRLRDAAELVLGWRFDALFARNILGEVSKRKRLGLAPDVMTYQSWKGCLATQVQAIDEWYCQQLRIESLLDFDDLVVECNKGLAGDEQCAEQVRERVRWLFIDEFQDVSPEQYAFIQLISPSRDPRAHLIAVGDPRQSIYRFRGADPDLISARFLHDYDPKIRYLSENFRSVPSVVACANAIKPQRKKPQELHARRDGVQPVVIIGSDHEQDEAKKVAALISRRLKMGDVPGSIGVLYGLHRRANLIEDALIGLGIKVRRIQPGGSYEHDAFETALAMLQMRVDPAGPAPHQLRAVACAQESLLDELDWISRDPKAAGASLIPVASVSTGDQRRFRTVRDVIDQIRRPVERMNTFESARSLMLLQQQLHDPVPAQDRDQFAETVRFLDRRLASDLNAPRLAIASGCEIRFQTADSLDARLAELILRDAIVEFPVSAEDAPPFVVAIGWSVPPLQAAINLAELGDHTFTATLATQAWFLGMGILRPHADDQRSYVVFDIETTSLDLNHAEIVELAAVRIDGMGQIVGEPFEQLVRVRQVPRDLSKLTGIQAWDLKDAPPIGDVLQSFQSWLRPDDVLVGHNAIEFDLAVINRHAAQQGLDAIIQPCIDTLPLARRYAPTLSHKLGDLAKSFGAPERPHHRALPDVLTTVEVFTHLRQIRAGQMAARAFNAALPLVAASIVLSDSPVGPDNQMLLNAGSRQLRSWPDHQLARTGADSIGPAWTACEHRLVATRDSREEEAWNDFSGEWLENIRRHLTLRPNMSLAEVSSHLSLSAGSTASPSEELVTMMSIHASKGKEWETVVITAVESDQFPSTSNPTDEEIAEGVRLLYVGVTRAKDRLALFYCHQRGEHRHSPHPLLDKFPANEQIVSRIFKRTREPAVVS